LGIGIPAVRGGFLGRVPGVRRPEVHHKLDGVAVDSEKAVLLETTTAARLRGAWLVWHNFADAPDLTKESPGSIIIGKPGWKSFVRIGYSAERGE
jgi:hypothetical protein